VQQQAKQVFKILKYFKIDEKITFFEFLNLLHLDEKTYILSLRSK
jgi:hypothetical protein